VLSNLALNAAASSCTCASSDCSSDCSCCSCARGGRVGDQKPRLLPTGGSAGPCASGSCPGLLRRGAGRAPSTHTPGACLSVPAQRPPLRAWPAAAASPTAWPPCALRAPAPARPAGPRC
jgi:hypothetical protein